jgi:hypothetical protein
MQTNENIISIDFIKIANVGPTVEYIILLGINMTMTKNITPNKLKVLINLLSGNIAHLHPFFSRLSTYT